MKGHATIGTEQTKTPAYSWVRKYQFKTPAADVDTQLEAKALRCVTTSLHDGT